MSMVEEALQRANATRFGLAGAVFTKDFARAHRVANKIQSGIVWINDYNITPPELPFGGYKQSGLGRENGLQAIEHHQVTALLLQFDQGPQVLVVGLQREPDHPAIRFPLA